jgi:hypothetical protein
MKNIKVNFLSFYILCAITIAYSCNNQQGTPINHQMPQESNLEDTINQGEYLVTIMGCNDCHSPKKMGPKGPELIQELMLSGYPSDRPTVNFNNPMIGKGFAMFYPDLTATIGPWGTSFAGNLTPDETGIGNWSEEQFKKALTQGLYKGLEGGRMLLPPMPWNHYAYLKDEDVTAIFLYLKSIKPVRNIVPAAIPPSNN